MKNSVRLFSAILAAMLCAAAFSACAGNAKPPVTDAPAITTDVPTTDAPLITTDTAVTTEPPVTTTAPATTEAVVTTETPDTDAPAIDSAASDFEYSANGNGGITITKYIRTDREQRVTGVTIPKEIDGKTVTAIGEAAFRYVSWMESLTMPDTVTHIGKAAFEKCLGLKTVALSNSLTGIGSLAFSECTALSDVTLPDSLTTIGASAFRGCTSLKLISIPGKCFTVPSSDGECFCGSGVEHVEFKAGVKYIPDGMFWTANVKTVILPDTVVEIGESAFSGCSGITEIKLGEHLISVGDFAFSGASVTSITIPKTVTSITEAAFDGCMKLEKVMFLGDAPASFVGTEKAANTSFTVYYTAEADGFTSPEWCGYETKVFDIADLYPEYPEELKEPFLSVVKGEKSFRYGNYNSYVTQFSEKISKVAIVDLDGDGKDEVVVRLQSQLIILRDTADGVIGLVCRHQAMNDINKDGTFYWNENAGLVYGCSSLTFTESSYTTTEHYRVEQGENGEVKYYVAGVKASETEYNAAAAKIAKDSVVWLDIAE